MFHCISKIKEARFMEIKVAGDSSLVVKFGNEIDEKINQKCERFGLQQRNAASKELLNIFQHTVQFTYI